MKAFDANGRLLPAAMTLVDADGEREAADTVPIAASSTEVVIRISVDATDATFPVVIDPLVTQAFWTADSDAGSSNYGWSVGPAGDVNGDGYADVIVGAYNYANGQSTEGAAFLYYGSASGLSSSPGWFVEGELSNRRLGTSVTTEGDLNGDNYGDVVVGAYTNGGGLGGAVFVWYGSQNGPTPGTTSTTPASAHWTATPSRSPARLGWCVATADSNGDDYDDVIASAHCYGNGQTYEGAAFLWFGSAAGLSGGAATSNTDAANWSYESNVTNQYWGRSVASAGDVNGDSYDDIVVGAYEWESGQTNEGAAFVFHGSSTGPSVSPSWRAETNQADAIMAMYKCQGADFNGDGYSDVAIPAGSYDAGQTNEGAIFVWYGSGTGLGADGNPTNVDWMAQSDQVDGYLQEISAGDFNDDGYADLAAGAFGYDGAVGNEGAVFVWFGSGTGLGPGNGTPANADWSVIGDQQDARFGISVAKGNVNNDGPDELIVGADMYDNEQTDEGRAYAFAVSGPLIPEPSSLVLLGAMIIAAAAFVLLRRRASANS
ncbi:PEP-CTERM sorting domain-containing protein [Planctomycetota bacterium]